MQILVKMWAFFVSFAKQLVNDSKLLDNEAKASLNQVLVNVIESELTSSFFQDGAIKTVEELNKTFLNENNSNYLCVIEAAKLNYDLNPSGNQKQALELITNLDATKYESLNLKVDWCVWFVDVLMFKNLILYLNTTKVCLRVVHSVNKRFNWKVGCQSGERV